MPGPKCVNQPNIPRPPNLDGTPSPSPPTTSAQHAEDLMTEGEIYVDANEHGLNGGSD
ncbi:hypothetical protein A2U01_0062257, partial [Trifolium medium]|nr:hypothetical protein [Trifolium medium]